MTWPENRTGGGQVRDSRGAPWRCFIQYYVDRIHVCAPPLLFSTFSGALSLPTVQAQSTPR